MFLNRQICAVAFSSLGRPPVDSAVRFGASRDVYRVLKVLISRHPLAQHSYPYS